MSQTRVLVISPAVWPGSAGSLARAVSDYAEALASHHADVAIAAPMGPGDEHGGLAKLLTPIVETTPTGRTNLTAYRGVLPGGRVQVLRLGARGQVEWTTFSHAAKRIAQAMLGGAPNLVHTWDRAAAALGGMAGSTRIATILSSQASTQNSWSLGLGYADAVVVPGAGPYGMREIPMGLRVGRLPTAPLSRERSRRELQKSVRLPATSRATLVVVTGPFSTVAIHELVNIKKLGVQLVFALHEKRDGNVAPAVRNLARLVPTRVSYFTGVGHAYRTLLALARTAADYELIAHKGDLAWESPLASVAYGTVPMVPRCDFFRGQVLEFDTSSRSGSGLVYDDDVLATLRRGQALRESGWLPVLQRRTKALDLSWSRVAARYLRLAAAKN